MFERFFAAMTVTFFAFAIATGCASTPTEQPTNLDNVHGEIEPSDLLDISVPVLRRDGDELVVSGTVTRKPGDEGDVDGHLEVLIFAEDHQTVLNQFPLSWVPDAIPVDGDRRSTYQVRYGYIPPAGSVVRIYFSSTAATLPRGGSGSSSSLKEISQTNTFSTKTPGRTSTPAQPRTPGTPKSGGASK